MVVVVSFVGLTVVPFVRLVVVDTVVTTVELPVTLTDGVVLIPVVASIDVSYIGCVLV